MSRDNKVERSAYSGILGEVQPRMYVKEDRSIYVK